MAENNLIDLDERPAPRVNQSSPPPNYSQQNSPANTYSNLFQRQPNQNYGSLNSSSSCVGQQVSQPYMPPLMPPVYSRDQISQAPFIKYNGTVYKKVSQRKVKLLEDYPIGFIVFHCVFMMISAIAQIGIQVKFSYDQTLGMFDIGEGFISGGVIILTVCMTLLTISCRNSCMVISSIVFHFMAMITILGCTVVMCAIALLNNNCFNTNNCGSNLDFLLTCGMVSLGTTSMIMCIVYAVYIQIKLIGGCNKKENRQTHVLDGYQNPIVFQN